MADISLAIPLIIVPPGDHVNEVTSLHACPIFVPLNALSLIALLGSSVS